MKPQKVHTLRYNSQEELFSMLRRNPHAGIDAVIKRMRSWTSHKTIHLDSSLCIQPEKSKNLKTVNNNPAMKNSLKSSVTESPDFKTWLHAQSAEPEYDYTQTVYCKSRQTEKRKKNYRNASIALLVMMNILFLIIAIL